ncbi:hypothetical protein [Kordiimonas sediminis]|uniref:hypothetical protein n=1 Tax=Kordiimonas sediminis TaxID=1735581 RepID=UPI00174CA9B0|nr:hypothetical protein [Kordiimonas sediminis]
MKSNTQTTFAVQAEYEANTLSRVLEQFTLRGLCYDTVSARKTKDGHQFIELYCSNLEDDSATVLKNKLLQIVTVRGVRMETLVRAAA